MNAHDLMRPVIIKDRKAARRFVYALEKASQQPPFQPNPNIRYVSDSEEIKKILSKKYLKK